MNASEEIMIGFLHVWLNHALMWNTQVIINRYCNCQIPTTGSLVQDGQATVQGC
jgi:hypothetical protein